MDGASTMCRRNAVASTNRSVPFLPNREFMASKERDLGRRAPPSSGAPRHRCEEPVPELTDVQSCAYACAGATPAADALASPGK